MIQTLLTYVSLFWPFYGPLSRSAQAVVTIRQRWGDSAAGCPDPWLGLMSIFYIFPHIAILASIDPQMPLSLPKHPLLHVHTDFPLTPLWGCEIKRNMPVPKISSQDMNSQSHLCLPPVPQKSQTISIIGRHGVSSLHATLLQLKFVDKKNTAVTQH